VTKEYHALSAEENKLLIEYWSNQRLNYLSWLAWYCAVFTQAERIPCRAM